MEWGAAKMQEITIAGIPIFFRSLGSGPPLLLLHGFPQTHIMWRSIAPLLAQQFTVICADIYGYGQSGCPVSDPQHTPYSKRVMAKGMVALMKALGFDQFSIAGHDRGGRIAYRLALDHPSVVKQLSVLDIIPTAAAWDKADRQFAINFWPWSLLAQPAPFPEQLLMAAPAAIINNALSGWGTPGTIFADWVKESYMNTLRDPVRVHAICEEYRAAATIDYMQDKEDQENGRYIHCPLLVLWSANGSLEKWYTVENGPLGVWQQWAKDVTGYAIQGGHFFPEENPRATAKALLQFFAKD